MESLKLRVKILLLVAAVSKRVETNTILVVGCHVAQLDGVPTLHDAGRAQRDNLVLEALRRDWLLHIVDLEVSDGESLRVDEQIGVVAWQTVQIEVDHGVSKVVITLLQCELEVVLDLTN